MEIDTEQAGGGFTAAMEANVVEPHAAETNAPSADRQRAGGSPEAVSVVLSSLATTPADGRALPAPALAPVGFAVTACLLVASLLTEGVVNLCNLLLYFAVRKRVQESCRRVILGAVPGSVTESGGATSAKDLTMRRGFFLALSAVALLGASSCRTIERDWDDTTWTLGVFADTSGDLESLADSVMVFAEVEPIGELAWSLDAMLGVTAVKDDSKSLVWTLEKFLR